MTDTPDPGKELEFVDRPGNRKAISALSLRLAGATLEEVCQVVGFASHKEAANAIDRALRDELKSDPKNRDRLRDIANKRLERLLRSTWGKATNPKDPEHLAAVGKAKDLIDRHIKLYGLDAPTEMVVHNPDASELEAWVMQAIQQGQPMQEDYNVLDAEIVSDSDEDDDPDAGVPARVGA